MSSVDVKEINEAYFNACNFESLMRGKYPHVSKAIFRFRCYYLMYGWLLGIHFAVFITALSNICTLFLEYINPPRVTTLQLMVPDAARSPDIP